LKEIEKERENGTRMCFIVYAVACDVLFAAIRMDCHRGNTSNCQLFSKNIKLVLLTLKGERKFEGLELAKSALFIEPY